MGDLGIFGEIQFWVQTQLTDNDIFAGVVGASVLLSLLMLLRSVPAKLWSLFLFQWTVNLIVYNEDDIYPWLDNWLSKHDYAQKTRRMKLSSHWENTDEDNNETWTVSPGLGKHFFWHKRKFVELTRSSEEGGNSQKRRETIELRTFGRTQAVIRDIVREAREFMSEDDRTDVFMYKDCWSKVASKTPRPLDSIVLPPDQLARVVGDVHWFLKSRKWFANRGVPHRRGYMLSGPPGCGKTSLVLGLASMLQWPVYALNLGSMRYDDELFEAMASVPEKAILLMEDIDAVGHNRSSDKKEEGEKDRNPLTISAVLNSIDGVMSTDGRLMIVTTNHPDRLDPALVRPGRIDMHEVIGPAGPEEAGRLFTKFFPNQVKVGQRLKTWMVEVGRTAPAANLQGAFMRYADDPLMAISAAMTEMNGKAQDDNQT